MLSLFSQIMICLFEPEHFFGIPPEAPGTAAKELAARMRGKMHVVFVKDTLIPQ